ncbi:MAG: hypothetical protein GX591_03215, partial [Planctomycetes bacterium]|nr:hypothetical protein [Planctomycetota bacterium]
ETLHHNAPGERFDRKVIDRLLARPNLLAIDGHPVRQLWQDVRGALSEYEVVDGSEVEDERTARVTRDDVWDTRTYRLGDDRGLRFQTTTVTLEAIRGRTAPVRLITAGRVFRPDGEDRTHSRVFHMADGICVAAAADVAAFKATCERVLAAAVPGAEVTWREHPFAIVTQGFVGTIRLDGRELLAIAGGILTRDVLRDAGHDAQSVGGFAWGMGLDRLAMLRCGIDDIHELWKPPYVPA